MACLNNIMTRQEYQKEYRLKNKERLAEYRKANYRTQEHRERRKAYDQKRYELNKEEILKMNREWWFKEENREQGRQKAKEWKIKNRERYLAAAAKRRARPVHKIAVCMQAALRRAIKYGKLPKSKNTSEYFEVSWDVIREHLESQFTEGMSWNNYGQRGWHIDHIKPISTFNISDPVQLKQCFHYTNLRPLWWKDNLSRPKNGSDLL